MTAQISAVSREISFRMSGNGSVSGQPSAQQVPPTSTAADLLDRMAAQHVSMEELCVRYWSIGGCCTGFEIGAYVHVGATLPRIECLLVEQALWELSL